MAADHYRLPRPVGPSPGVELGATRPSTAEAVRAFVRSYQSARWIELLAMLGLALVAVAIRLPNLWSVPSLADDASQLVPALDVYETRTWLATGTAASHLTTVYDVALAAAFMLIGPSLQLPRLLGLVQAAISVPLVYILTRELCRPLGRRRLDDTFVIPRLAGLVAAGLLATSAAHVVITSHVAGAASFAPLLVLGSLFAVERALGARDGRWLIPGGALFGLAVQMHPSTLALLPGVALALGWRGRSLLLSRWALLGIAALALGCTNVLIQVVRAGLSLSLLARNGRALHEGPYPGGGAYLDALGNAIVSLWRLASGELAGSPTFGDLVREPAAWPIAMLVIVGSLVLIPRGRPLLPLAGLSSLLIVPYFAAPYDAAVSDRYLMPAVVIGIVGAGVGVGLLAPAVAGRGSVPRLALGVILGGLVLAPVGGLRSYYGEVSADGRPGDGLLLILQPIFDERRYDQAVLLDENLARLKLGAGGHALESLRYLLTVSGVPTRTIHVTPEALAAETTGGRALVILERGSVRIAEVGARLDPLLDDWIMPGPNTDGEVMVFSADRLPSASLPWELAVP